MVEILTNGVNFLLQNSGTVKLICGIIAIVCVWIFIVESAGLIGLCQRMKIKGAGFAFIPFVHEYKIGYIADKERYNSCHKATIKRMLLTVLSILSIACALLLAFSFKCDVYDRLTSANAVEKISLWMNLFAPMVIVGIVLVFIWNIYRAITLKYVYNCKYNHPTLLAVISFILPITTPIFLVVESRMIKKWLKQQDCVLEHEEEIEEENTKDTDNYIDDETEIPDEDELNEFNGLSKAEDDMPHRQFGYSNFDSGVTSMDSDSYKNNQPESVFITDTNEGGWGSGDVIRSSSYDKSIGYDSDETSELSNDVQQDNSLAQNSDIPDSFDEKVMINPNIKDSLRKFEEADMGMDWVPAKTVLERKAPVKPVDEPVSEPVITTAPIIDEIDEPKEYVPKHAAIPVDEEDIADNTFTNGKHLDEKDRVNEEVKEVMSDIDSDVPNIDENDGSYHVGDRVFIILPSNCANGKCPDLGTPMCSYREGRYSKEASDCAAMHSYVRKVRIDSIKVGDDGFVTLNNMFEVAPEAMFRTKAYANDMLKSWLEKE